LIPRVAIRNGSNGQILASSAVVAVTAWSRLKGLLGKASLGRGEGLVLPGCSSIHMFFMRFPIDVLFLDAARRVCAVRQGLKPFRIAWGGFRARHTIELPSGTVAATGTAVGHLVAWDEV
jgi:uncharacterized protein